MKRKFYKAYDNDMWNDGEGFSSNDKYSMHLIVSLTDDTKSESIRPALVKHGYLKPRFRWIVTLDDEFMIELSRPDYSSLLTFELIDDDDALDYVAKDGYDYISL